MVKLLSYLYPITKTIPSEFNGPLEITWHNGIKHLNTKNANYSYGSLQKILRYGLHQLPLQELQSVLILGMGGGCVIDTLRSEFDYQQHITAVEIDPVIIEVAKTEFNIQETNLLEIVCADAEKFMKDNSKNYDLIIIDLFIDTLVPSLFLELPFWTSVLKCSTKKGRILFNASLNLKDDKMLMAIISLLDEHQFESKLLEGVNDTNTLLVATAFN